MKNIVQTSAQAEQKKKVVRLHLILGVILSEIFTIFATKASSHRITGLN